jgi:epoxyqueuosine reductase
MKNVEYCVKYNDNFIFSSNKMVDAINRKMMENGYAVQVVPIERLKDLQKDVENLKSSDSFNEVVNTIVNDFYRFDLPEVPFKINSIIVVASPSPLVKVNFNWRMKKIPVMIPPTYFDSFENPIKIESCLNEILSPNGFNIKSAQGLPHKLLGVRSGLSVYGRNNISYINSMGSFALLSAYYSDMKCMEDNWHEIRQMESCKSCTACLNKCPTAAITDDRYLIKVERCITYHNEFTGLCDFPQWIDPSSHNCIVGCLNCQICCPKNKEYLNNIVESVEFNDEETLLLLEGRKFEDIPSSLVQKIKQLNLVDYFDLLPRNLKVLLDKEI